MRLLKILLLINAIVLLTASLLIKIMNFDPVALQTILTSDKSWDDLALWAFKAIPAGFALAAAVLLLLALLFHLSQKNVLKFFTVSTRTFLFLILGIQVLLGLIYINLPHFEATGDSVWYLNQAKHLYAGQEVANTYGQPTAFWPIGYPFLLSLLYHLFGSNYQVALIFNVALLAGVTLFTYLIGKRLFNENSARSAAMIIAFLPSQTFYAFVPLADIPFTALFLAIIYLALGRINWISTLSLGLLMGLAMLTRPILMFFPCLIAIHHILRGNPWKSILARTVVIYLLAEAVLLPWQIRNYHVFNSFVLVSNNGGYNLLMGNNPHSTGGVLPEYAYLPQDTLDYIYKTLNEVQRDKYYTRQAEDYALSHPLQTVLLWPRKIMHLFYKDSKCITYGYMWDFEQVPPPLLMAMIAVTEGYYYALGLAFLFAIVKFIRQKNHRPEFWLIFGAMAYFIVMHLPFICEGRFHIPLIPMLALIVASYGNRAWTRSHGPYNKSEIGADE